MTIATSIWRILITIYLIVAGMILIEVDRKAQKIADSILEEVEADPKTELIQKEKLVWHDGLIWLENEPQTESLEQFRVGLEYHTDTTHFGKAKGKSVTTDTADTPHTEREGE